MQLQCKHYKESSYISTPSLLQCKHYKESSYISTPSLLQCKHYKLIKKSIRNQAIYLHLRLKRVIAGSLTPLCPVLGLPRNRGSIKQHFALRSSSRHDFVLCCNTLVLRLASLTIPFSFLGQQNQTFFAGLPHFTYRSFYFFIFTFICVE